jgi:hypothetical protein
MSFHIAGLETNGRLAQQGFPDEDHITLVNEFQFCFTFRHDASHRKIYKDAQAIRLPIVLYGED